MMADREQLSLGAAPTLPDQLAVPRSRSFSPSDAVILLKLADNAAPGWAPDATFSVTVMTPPLALLVPYTLKRFWLTRMLQPLTEHV